MEIKQDGRGQMGSVRQVPEEDENAVDLNPLLLRLDSDTAIAWDKYRNLRLRLVKFFELNQSTFPEDLADEVLDRIAKKPVDEEIREISEFVIGVARNVLKEGYRRSLRESHIEDWPGGEESLEDPRNRGAEIVENLDHERKLAVLRECLGKLDSSDRALALDYYSAIEEKKKIHRQRLAVAAGITMIALRVRTSRLRDKLERCVSNGLEAERRSREAAGGRSRQA